MAGMPILGLVLNLDATGAITSLQRLGAQFTSSFAQYNSAITQARHNATALGMVFQNYVTQRIMQTAFAMQHLSSMFRNASRSMIRGIMSAQQASDSYEASLSRVRIVMGMTGDNINAPQLVEEYASIRTEIERIAAATEFSLDETAQAFTYLKQTGRSAQEAINLTPSIMALSSASGQLLTLTDSARIAQLSITALNSSAEELPDTMDQIVRAVQRSPLEFRDIPQMLASMGGVGAIFRNTDASEFLAIGGMLKQVGRSAAQAGQDMQIFGRFTGFSARAFAAVNAGETGPGTGAMRMRARALEDLGITYRDFVDMTRVDPTTGLFELQSAPAVLTNLVTRLGEARDRFAAAGGTAQQFGERIQAATGRQQMANMLLQMVDAVDDGRVSLADLADQIADTNNDAVSAQEEYLKTTVGMWKVLTGVFESFLVRVAEPWQGFVDNALYALIKFFEKANRFAQANPRLVKTFAFMTIALTAMITVLAAALSLFTFLALTSMILGPMFAASATGALSFGAILRTVLLRGAAPLLIIMWPLIKAMLIFTAISYLLYKAWDLNLGGIRDILGGLLKDAWDVFSNLGKMLSGEGVDADTWEKMSDNAKDMLQALIGMIENASDFLKGFAKSGPEWFYALEYAANLVLGPLIFVAWALWKIFEISAWLMGVNLGDSFETNGEWAGWLSAKVFILAVTFWAFYRVIMLVKSGLMLLRGAMWGYGLAVMAVRGMTGAVAAGAAGGAAGGLFGKIGIALAFVGAKLAPVARAFRIFSSTASYAIRFFVADAIALFARFGGAIARVAVAIGGFFMRFGLISKIVGVVRGVFAVFSAVAAAVGVSVTTMIALFAGALAAGFSLGNMVGVIFKDAGDRALGVVLAARGAMLAIVAVIITLAVTAASYIASIGGMAAAVAGGLGSLLLTPLALIALLVGLALGMLWAVRDEIRILFNFFVDAMRDFGRIFLRAGFSLIDNLITGMRSGASKLWETMEWMMSGVSGYFQFSPAERGPLADRPMELAGSNIPKLLTQGMETGIPRVRIVAGQLATAVGTPQGSFMPSIPTPPTAATANATAQRPSANITLNVNVGDVNAQVSELDPASARSFIDSIGPELMRYLTAEMRRQGMVTG